MTKKKEAVEIVVIMDRSGSMSSVRNEAIGGFNNFLVSQQSLPGAANLTVIQFDDQYEVPVDGVKLKDVKPFTEDDFVPRGYTAMNDAIGRALTQLLTKDPKKAIVCIITDGAENASKEFNYAKVKELIAQAEAKEWEIVFLASGIDAQSTSASLGMTRGVVMQASADAAGEISKYTMMASVSTSYRSQ